MSVISPNVLAEQLKPAVALGHVRVSPCNGYILNLTGSTVFSREAMTSKHFSIRGRGVVQLGRAVASRPPFLGHE